MALGGLIAMGADAACESVAYRDFDFWLGYWAVYTPDGTLAGHNQITAEYGGCVLHERYSTPGAFRGESLNSYDPGREQWHQTWVDNAGTLLLLSGRLEGKDMVLSGTTKDREGDTIKHRIRWTPQADGTVRQLWQQQSNDTGWSTVFDGEYRRQKPESRAQ